MTPEMERLVELQEVLQKLFHAMNQLALIPKERAALEAAKAEAEADYARAEKALETLTVERRNLETELKGLESTAQKYREQLMGVKTNREYTALLHEIDAVKAHISELETDILERMEKIEAEKEKLADAEERKKTSLAKLESRGKELDQHEEAWKAQETKLRAEQDRIKKDIKPAVFNRFHRIAKVRQGVALAEAVDERCAACQERLRVQIWHKVRHTDEMVNCEGCGRFLYYNPPREGA